MAWTSPASAPSSPAARRASDGDGKGVGRGRRGGDARGADDRCRGTRREGHHRQHRQRRRAGFRARPRGSEFGLGICRTLAWTATHSGQQCRCDGDPGIAADAAGLGDAVCHQPSRSFRVGGRAAGRARRRVRRPHCLGQFVGHLGGAVDFDDIHFQHRPDQWVAYGQSKTANVLFAVGAGELWASNAITANALNPADTVRQSDAAHGSAATDIDDAHRRQHRCLLEERAAGSGHLVLLAAFPLLDGVTGRYFEDCNEAGPHQAGFVAGWRPTLSTRRTPPGCGRFRSTLLAAVSELAFRHLTTGSPARPDRTRTRPRQPGCDPAGRACSAPG